MNAPRTRRDFLADVGRGMLVTTLGFEVASGLGVAPVFAGDAEETLSFGGMEPLVRMMQETPAAQLLPKLVSEIRSGTNLRQLVGAAALANARTFGGEDYIGFHTVMALAPAYYMSQELPAESQALPVFKVLYRNTNRIQEHGGRKDEVLHPVAPASSSEPRDGGESLRAAIRNRDVKLAEQKLAASAQRSAEDAFNDLLLAVHDTTEVHRVVLPYRAYDLLGIVGKEHAHTLLRQSVRYCVKAEGWSRPSEWMEPRTLVPKLFDEHHLMGRTPGDRVPDDAWIEGLCDTFFKATPDQAAAAAAAALAEGMAPAAVGEAITLAANQLVLRDQGRPPTAESAGKPIGSVHGDSIGVHASDSANAWRNMARVSNARNSFASLILGAYQVALDRSARGSDFLKWQPLPVKWHLDAVKSNEPAALLADAEEEIRSNMQARASAIIHHYGELGHPARPVFDLLLKYAISEDGALHAEKYYRTATEEFSASRPAFRWRHLVGLTRVTASEYGRPAPGMAEARSLLKLA